MKAKITAWIILFCFTATTIGWSAPASSVTSNEFRVTSERNNPELRIPSFAESVELPEDIGKIEERYVPSRYSLPATRYSPVIVHIQDAHSNYEAQVHIKEILTHLKKAYGLDLVFVEGSMDGLDPELLEFFKDPQLNQKAVDLLAREGIVSGVELFLANQGRFSFQGTVLKTKDQDKNRPLLSRSIPNIVAYGVEDKELYRKNLAAFRSVLKQKETAQKFLEGLKSGIVTASSKAFNKRLREFFQRWLFYEDHRQEIVRHLDLLQKYAQDDLDLDLRDARNQLAWPQLVRFFKLKEFEIQVDVKKAEADRQKLIVWTKEQKLGEEYIKGIDSVATLPRNDTRSVVASEAKQSPRSFLEHFYEAASRKGFSFKQYPHFSRAAGLSILQKELQAEDLFNEIHKLTETILEALAKKENEKALIRTYKDYRLLTKLLLLELTREEYQQVIARKERLKPSSIIKGVGFRSQALGFRGAKTQNLTPDTLFLQALHFYSLARKRDSVIFKKMLSKMKELGKANAVLITGGFHSEGLQKQFKENQISFVEVSPRISEVAGNQTYLNTMFGSADYLTLRSYLSPTHIAEEGGLAELSQFDPAAALQDARMLNLALASAAREKVVAEAAAQKKSTIELFQNKLNGALPKHGLSYTSNGELLLTGQSTGVGINSDIVPIKIEGRFLKLKSRARTVPVDTARSIRRELDERSGSEYGQALIDQISRSEVRPNANALGLQSNFRARRSEVRTEDQEQKIKNKITQIWRQMGLFEPIHLTNRNQLIGQLELYGILGSADDDKEARAIQLAASSRKKGQAVTYRLQWDRPLAVAQTVRLARMNQEEKQGVVIRSEEIRKEDPVALFKVETTFHEPTETIQTEVIQELPKSRPNQAYLLVQLGSEKQAKALHAQVVKLVKNNSLQTWPLQIQELVRRSQDLDILQVLSARSELRAGISRILLVDDEEGIRSLLKMGIQSWANDRALVIDEAGNPQEALAKFQAAVDKGEPYELVWSDIEMKTDKNGIDLAKDLKLIRPETQIVLASGNFKKFEALIKPLLEKEVFGFLAKPFGFEKVQSMLSQVDQLARSEARSNLSDFEVSKMREILQKVRTLQREFNGNASKERPWIIQWEKKLFRIGQELDGWQDLDHFYSEKLDPPLYRFIVLMDLFMTRESTDKLKYAIGEIVKMNFNDLLRRLPEPPRSFRSEVRFPIDDALISKLPLLSKLGAKEIVIREDERHIALPVTVPEALQNDIQGREIVVEISRPLPPGLNLSQYPQSSPPGSLGFYLREILGEKIWTDKKIDRGSVLKALPWEMLQNGMDPVKMRDEIFLLLKSLQLQVQHPALADILDRFSGPVQWGDRDEKNGLYANYSVVRETTVGEAIATILLREAREAFELVGIRSRLGKNQVSLTILRDPQGRFTSEFESQPVETGTLLTVSFSPRSEVRSSNKSEILKAPAELRFPAALLLENLEERNIEATVVLKTLGKRRELIILPGWPEASTAVPILGFRFVKTSRQNKPEYAFDIHLPSGWIENRTADFSELAAKAGEFFNGSVMWVSRSEARSGSRNREGYGFARGRLTQQEASYYDQLLPFFENQGFNVVERDGLLNALVRIKEKALQLRTEFFSPAEAEQILQYRIFDTRSLLAKILEERKKYQEKKDEKEKLLFKANEIRNLLFKRIIPLSWIEELMKEGVSKSLATYIVTNWSNPKEIWEEVMKPTRDELVESGVSKTQATYIVTHWSNPKETWGEILKPIRDELVESGVSKSLATYIVTGWSNPKETWEEVLKPVRDELVESGVSKSQATYIVTHWSNPKETWEEVLKPIRDELVESGVSKSQATFIVTHWSNPKETWEEVMKPIRDELVESGVSKTQATYIVTRWSNPKKTWEEVLKPIRDELVESGVSKSQATYIVTNWSNPKEIWEEVMKPVRDELVESGVSKNQATYIVTGWSNPKETWEEVLKPVRDELVESGVSKSQATYIVTHWSNPKETWERVRKPVRDELVESGVSKTQATRIVTRWANPKETWEEVLKPVRDELVESGVSKTQATRIVTHWSNPKETWEEVMKPIRDELVESGVSKTQATYIVTTWSNPQEKYQAVQETIANLRRRSLLNQTEAKIQHTLLWYEYPKLLSIFQVEYGKSKEETERLLVPLKAYEEKYGQEAVPRSEVRAGWHNHWEDIILGTAFFASLGLGVYFGAPVFSMLVGFSPFLIWYMSRRAKEQARLSDAEKKFKNSPIPFHRLDTSGKIIEVNQGWLKTLGYEKEEEVLGKSILDFIVPEQRENAWERFNERLEFGEARTPKLGDRWYVKKDGTRIRVQTSDTVERDAQGKAVDILTSFQDITQQRAAEEALRKSEQLHRKLLASIPYSIFVKDAESRFVSVNEQFAKDFGWDNPNDLIGLTDYDLLKGKDGMLSEEKRQLAEKFRADDQAVRQSQHPQIFEERSILNGQLKVVNTAKAPLIIDGKDAGLIGIYADVTAHKQAETELLRMERLSTMEETIRQVAHEIANPASNSALILYDLINRLRKGEAIGQNDLEKILLDLQHEVERISEITARTLGFLKPQSEKRPLYIENIVRETLGFTRFALGNAGINIVQDIGNDYSIVIGRRKELIGAFMNLIVNAKNAMKDSTQKQLTIQVRPGKNSEGKPVVRILFADTGRGISENTLIKLRRGERISDTPDQKGTGIGLANVREVIQEEHQGQIEIESQTDKGSSFVVELPVFTPGIVPLQQKAALTQRLINRSVWHDMKNKIGGIIGYSYLALEMPFLPPEVSQTLSEIKVQTEMLNSRVSTAQNSKSEAEKLKAVTEIIAFNDGILGELIDSLKGQNNLGVDINYPQIAESVEQVRRILQDIRAIRVDTSFLEKPAPLSVIETLQTLLNFFSSSKNFFRENDIVLGKLEIPLVLRGRDVTAMVDRPAFLQALFNIISLGMKHGMLSSVEIKNGPKILNVKVDLNDREGEVILSFHNNYSRFSDEELKSVTSEYGEHSPAILQWQGENSNDLAVSSRLLAFHAGRLLIQNRQDGSDIRLFLPYFRQNGYLVNGTTETVKEAAEEFHPEPDVIIPGAKKILVADDEKIQRDLFPKILAGYNVWKARYSQEAFDLIAAAQKAGEPFDLAILDVTMNPPPGIPNSIANGILLARKLRKDGFKLPILISTGHAVYEEYSGLQDLVSGIIWKVSPPEEKLEMIQKIMEQQKMLEQKDTQTGQGETQPGRSEVRPSSNELGLQSDFGTSRSEVRQSELWPSELSRNRGDLPFYRHSLLLEDIKRGLKTGQLKEVVVFGENIPLNKGNPAEEIHNKIFGFIKKDSSYGYVWTNDHGKLEITAPPLTLTNGINANGTASVAVNGVLPAVKKETAGAAKEKKSLDQHARSELRLTSIRPVLEVARSVTEKIIDSKRDWLVAERLIELLLPQTAKANPAAALSAEASTVLELIRSAKEGIAPFAYVKDPANEVLIRQLFESADLIVGENQDGVNRVVLLVKDEKAVKVLHEKWIDFLKANYGKDPQRMRKLEKNVPILAEGNRLVSDWIPSGIKKAWIEWVGEGEWKSIPSIARETQIHANQLRGNQLIPHFGEQGGYGVSLLQAALLLLKGPEDSKLQKTIKGPYVQQALTAFQTLGRVFNELLTLRQVSRSA